MIFTISPAAPADIPAAAKVIAAAFAHEPVISTLVGSGGDPLMRGTALFRALLMSGALRTGRIDLARRATDGEILGVAIWEAPGSHATLLDQTRQLPSFLQDLGWRGIIRAARFQASLAAHRPAEPHWYLAQLGVGSAARGLGVGSALLRGRLEHNDATVTPSYLESSNARNRKLYERHGFVTISRIPSIREGAAMWRRVNAST